MTVRDKVKHLVRSSTIMRNAVFPVIKYKREAKNRKLRRTGALLYQKDRVKYEELIKGRSQYSFALDPFYDYPIYIDRFAQAGSLDAYFWQDLWAAKLVFKLNPGKHYDIGSRVDGFIGHLASFRDNIILIDVRELNGTIPGVSFFQADATNLEEIENDCIESISALCSLEHFGLGRYGEEVDPDAWEKAMKSIARVVKPGGHAFIAVPIGKEHVEFNAHRIFFAQTVIDAFAPLRLVSLSCTDGSASGIEENVPIHKYDLEDNHGTRFGLFHFVK